jgi:hypothetical protein
MKGHATRCLQESSPEVETGGTMGLFKRIAKSGAFFACCLTLAACASGPSFSEMSSKIPNLAADGGRIYIYRTTVLGAAVQPSVKVNGDVVGSAVPQGFFYVDRPPGSYKITTSTEVDRDLSLTLEAAQTRYVRLGISIGFFVGHVYPELVDNAEGQSDVSTLHYTGQ